MDSLVDSMQKELVDVVKKYTPLMSLSDVIGVLEIVKLNAYNGCEMEDDESKGE